jgi:hypothetical protein
MYLDVCRFSPTAGGTTDFVVSAAVSGYQTPAAAGGVDSGTYYYRAESADLTQWEVGIGTYAAGTTTLARTTVLFNSSGTTAKISFAAAPQVAIVALAEGLREKLAANRTYFVRTDGSDSNSGLANSAAGAFLTIQKAIDTACALDLSTFNVTIQLATGTYSGGNVLKSYIGAGPILIKGDTTTPSNVVVSASSTTCFLADTVLGKWQLQGMQFKITGVTASFCLEVLNGSIVEFSKVDFNTTPAGSSHILTMFGGRTYATDAYTISSGAGAHVQVSATAYFGMGVIGGANVVCTLTGTPAFTSAFAVADRLASWQVQGAPSFSGSATGTRYTVNANSLIFTSGAGANFLPGNAAGTATNGGLYL